MRKILLSSTAVAGLAAMLTLAAAPVSAHGIHHKATIDPTAISVGDFNGQTLTFGTFDTTKGHLQSVLVVEDLTAHYGPRPPPQRARLVTPQPN
jgi:hypothetical protein